MKWALPRGAALSERCLASRKAAREVLVPVHSVVTVPFRWKLELPRI